jgi:hypothetical protein
MNKVNYVFGICLSLLIGQGLQTFIVGMALNELINFSGFSIFQWIFQILWWVVLVTFGIMIVNQETKSGHEN